MTGAPYRVVVAGLGSEYRCDDGAGPLVAARAVESAGGGEDIGPLTDPLDLLGAWDGAALAIVVDAVRSGRPPGTVSVFELTQADGTDVVTPAPVSTHGIGLAGVLSLARMTGTAPARVVLVGIEGERFERGTGLSPPVEAALSPAVRRVVELLARIPPCA